MSIYHEHIHCRRISLSLSLADSWGVDFDMVVINKYACWRARTRTHACTHKTHISSGAEQINMLLPNITSYCGCPIVKMLRPSFICSSWGLCGFPFWNWTPATYFCLFRWLRDAFLDTSMHYAKINGASWKEASSTFEWNPKKSKQNKWLNQKKILRQLAPKIFIKHRLSISHAAFSSTINEMCQLNIKENRKTDVIISKMPTNNKLYRSERMCCRATLPCARRKGGICYELILCELNARNEMFQAEQQTTWNAMSTNNSPAS